MRSSVLARGALFAVVGALVACGSGADEDRPAMTGTTPSSAATTAISTTAASAPAATTAVTVPTTQPPVPAPSPNIGTPAVDDRAEASAQPVAPAPAPAPAASTAPADPAGFTFAAITIDDALRARMEPTSWRAGCPVGPDELRYLEVSYRDYGGTAHLGELVVHRDVVDTMRDVFARMWAADTRVNSMRLVDDFGGSDDASTAADNTSAFNCRVATGSTDRWSNHATGRAIDINPLRNPYIGAGGAIAQPDGETFRDRILGLPGMITEGDATVAAFDAHGWDWGGRWTSPVDYQHFSADGG